MCQVSGDADELIPPKTTFKNQKTCVKCDGKAFHVVGTNGTFCSECFEKYFTHKFRAAMGRNPIVRHGDGVLVAYSGGNNSSALLHLIKQGLSPSAIKKLKFKPGILFVDERTMYPDHNVDAEVEDVQNIMEKSGFPHHTVKLEEVFESTDSNDDMSKGDSAADSAMKLTHLMKSTKTLSAKQELLYRFRCLLISKTARKLGYQHVFLGETSTRLAINILSNVASGRGAHLSQDTGFSDGNRYSDVGVQLLRPLRDITAKEIVMYNGMHKVPTVFLPNLSTKKAKMSSIPNLTEDFVLGLVAGFPSTEMTVYRTSNKIKTINNAEIKQKNPDVAGSAAKCRICFGHLDFNLQKSVATASNDTAYSTLICKGAIGHSIPNNSNDVADKNNPVTEIMQEHKNELCYACARLEKEVILPRDVNLLTLLPTLTADKPARYPQSDVDKLKSIMISD